MRTVINIADKEYRVGITPQTYMYFAKVMGLNQLKLLTDKNMMQQLFAEPTIEMMEAMFFAALKVGARLDGKQLDITKEQASEAYLLEPNVMQDFGEAMELAMGTDDSGEPQGKPKG